MPADITIHRLSPTDQDLAILGECQILAFGDSPIALRKEPEPRVPPAERYESTGLRFARMMRDGAIAWKAVLDGKAVGVIVLNEPGWRNKLVTAEEGKGPAFKGYDVQYYNSFTKHLQDARNQCMVDQDYWYIRLLVVHPSSQRKGVGSQLMDTLLTFIEGSLKPDLPVVTEPTVAGQTTYRARGFAYKASFKYPMGQPDGQVWVKPGIQV